MRHPDHKRPKIRAQYHKAKNWFQQNSKIIGGLAVLVASLFLIAKSVNFVVNFAVFIAGLILLYYSLRILKLNDLTTIIDRQLTFIKSKFRK